jgi:thiosulfate dehydrogenase [quinone] large subunit
MITAFFESIKYVGHVIPVAALRLYVGYYFVERAFERYQGDYLLYPRLASSIMEHMATSTAPSWYKWALEVYVVPNWQIFAYMVTYIEFLMGLSFLLGFLVRPTALVGLFLIGNVLYSATGAALDFNRLMFAVLFLFLWIGAGRCLGMDYFFYKRKRGLLW